MTVTVTWDDPEKTRLLFTYEGHWTWDEALITYEQALEMLDSVSHVVDLMTDMSASSGMPPSALSHMGNIGRRLQTVPNSGVIVAIGADRFVRMMAEMFKKVFPRLVVDTYFVETVDEARDLLILYREEIADRELLEDTKPF